MDDGSTEIRWAPRVRQEKVRQLYENDARGFYDQELIDDVGYSLYARCQSFLTAVEAAQGRARCPRCGTLIPHHRQPEEVLRCEGCGWQTTWHRYFKSFQHQQLSGAEPVVRFFQEFLDRFPVARDYREKVFLIDRLLHGFHWYLGNTPTRPTAVNLIEGRLSEVVAFLESLTYGEAGTPGLKENREVWDERIQAYKSWGRPAEPKEAESP